MRTRFTVASLNAFMVCALCSPTLLRGQTPSPTPPAPAQFREVVDETGRTIRIPQPVLRIVSLAPSLTETVYALGIQDRLAGDTDFCDYPADAQKKPKVGGGLNPSLEEIAALHPDLVLAAKAFNRLDTVLALQTLHIAAYATDPHTADQSVSSTRRLTDILRVPKPATSIHTTL
jgi:iron complex transport system substrate-binding protein